ncbi:hypothetical protein CHS0354_020921 [Potamilus streckersoni]|uniref:Uncharacterized protein n=1 Tax=Potamilus streckersoni TaxID=2493646 RepID=A0AAE0SV90_9BIVA|nr:hypothetical protein CHS0354_020921 [Potamilus streckersoni]
MVKADLALFLVFVMVESSNGQRDNMNPLLPGGNPGVVNPPFGSKAESGLCGVSLCRTGECYGNEYKQRYGCRCNCPSRY